MEGISNKSGLRNESDASGWEAWNAVPRDGPAVFIVDVGAFDCGVVRGRWFGVKADQEELRAELTDLLGYEPEEGSWAIVDQVGLGDLMAPETMTVADLTAVSADLAAEGRG